MKHRHLSTATAALIAALATHSANAGTITFAPWGDAQVNAPAQPVTTTGATVDRPWFQRSLDVDLRRVDGHSVTVHEPRDFTPWFLRGQLVYRPAADRDRDLAGR